MSLEIITLSPEWVFKIIFSFVWLSEKKNDIDKIINRIFLSFSLSSRYPINILHLFYIEISKA